MGTEIAKEIDANQPEKDLLDLERRKAVDESVRLYRERNSSKLNKNKSAGMKVTSENYNKNNNLSSSSLSSRDMDAMSVLNLEYKSMTSSQKNILDERIMEAEEEEEDYKNERAKMKAMSHTSRTTTRTTSATRSITNDDQDEDEEEEEVGWSLDEDALVQKLTRTYLFDFDAVAKEMNKDKKDIRLRFALLSSNNGVAPIAVPKKNSG